MVEQVKKINNPLTIIAIFAALAEVSATISISLIDKNLHYIFIWFIIGFPSLLVLLFFLTLNYNTKVLYSPSDFREDKAFMDTLYGTQNTNAAKSFHESGLTLEAFSEFEKKIIQNMEEKFKTINPIDSDSMKKFLEDYKLEIKQISEETIIENEGVDLKLPLILRSAIVKWISFPAFIPIIYAILKENSKSIEDLEKVKSKYNFTKMWNTSGIRGLLDSDILVGNVDQFHIKESLKDDLTKWININESVIAKIIDNFGNYSGKGKEWLANQNNILTQNIKI